MTDDQPWATCIDGKLNTGDTAFMIFATTMVMMQTPATGIAQAGMIRSKNTLSMLNQIFTGTVIGSILWFTFGYGIVFGQNSNSFYGNPFENFILLNVPVTDCWPGQSIPAYLYVGFQMMFALMVPLIMTGAWAERMTFKAFLIVVIVWPFFVYYPLAHWIWNPAGWLATMGILDFAGGLTIHTSAGVGALVISLYLDKRKMTKEVMAGKSSNLTLTLIGTVLIWAGWYSFNGGSALAANDQSAYALMNTHMSASFSAMVWLTASFATSKMFSMTEVLSGTLAGLAAITPGSGFVSPQASSLIGLIAGILSFVSSKILKRKGVDDVLDCFSLQAVPGVVGILCTALFANEKYHASNITSRSHLFGVQLLGCVVTIGLAAVATYGIIVLADKLVGANIDVQTELEGLDMMEIGEVAYGIEKDNDEDDLGTKLCAYAAKGELLEIKRFHRIHNKLDHVDYDDRSALHIAAAEGQFKVVEFLVKKGLDVNARDKFGRTPIVDALMKGQRNIVRYLKDQNAEIEIETQIENWLASIVSEDQNMIKCFMDFGIDVNCMDYDNRTALHLAVSHKMPKITTALVHLGADPQIKDRWGQTAIFYAFDEASKKALKEENNVSTPTLLEEIEQTQGTKAADKKKEIESKEMLGAVSNGQVDEVKRLIGKNCTVNEPDYDGRTPLHIAASNNNLAIVKLLLSVKDINVNPIDNFEMTPFHDAITNNFSEVAELLKKKHGVIVHRQLGYKLCQAGFKGDLNGLKNLKKHGALLDTADYDLRTALHLAACQGHRNCVIWLLDQGADRKVQDFQQNTPIQDAQENGHYDIVTLLGQGFGINQSIDDSRLSGMLQNNSQDIGSDFTELI